MVVVGTAAVLFVGLILLQNARESHLWGTVEATHLRSLSIEGQIAEELAALGLAAAEASPQVSDLPGEALSLSRGIQAIRAGLEELAGLQEASGGAEFAPAFDRARERFDRLEETLGALERGEAAARLDLPAHLASLSLAVEQLRRLHSIATNRALASLELRAADRTERLLLCGVALAATVFLAGWRIKILRRVGQVREKEMQAALEESHARLLHSEKIEALGTLAGGVAHDFNNLLTVIAVHAEMLRNELGAENPLRSSIQAIERATQEAAILTRQLSAFSRRDIRDSRVIDLNDVVRRVESMLQKLVGEKIAFVTRLDPGIKPVKVDPAQIEQVLLNLVVNARDAMPEGGTMTIETVDTRLDPGPWDPGSHAAGQEYARLSVHDTGRGIDEATRNRIFEPFFTTKPPSEGTGLGLFMVHGIISASGGVVSFESETGVGTRFDVCLPACNDSEAGETQPGDTRTTEGSETILLIEDQRQVREVCAQLLREAGYAVLEAENGAEALHLCAKRRKRIDLILTDVVMPVMDGPELVERSKQLHPEARVLYMSGYTEDPTFRERISDSNIPLLPKPFQRIQLLERVRTALDSGCAGS
jgi:signal transduction histidine kinase/ActR/RegA family two-component response regulator